MEKREFKKLLKQAQTKKLTAKEREKAPGEYAFLKSGFTHYEMRDGGDDTKPPVVLVHGYSTPYFLYDHVFDALIEEGYRVIRYDLLGRGLSERVKSKYDPKAFAVQLKELVDELIPGEKFIAFGTSMGGSILACFCAMYPDLVEKMVLYAPAGMDNFKAPIYMKLTTIPFVGKRVFYAIGVRSLLSGSTREFHVSGQDVQDDFLRKLAYSMRYKGYIAGTYGSLINTILATRQDTKYYKKMAKQKIPTLVIWGTEDATMPIYQLDRMAKVLPHAEFVIFEGSGHIFLYDEGERTVAHTLPFLEEN